MYTQPRNFGLDPPEIDIPIECAERSLSTKRSYLVSSLMENFICCFHTVIEDIDAVIVSVLSCKQDYAIN